MLPSSTSREGLTPQRRQSSTNTHVTQPPMRDKALGTYPFALTRHCSNRHIASHGVRRQPGLGVTNVRASGFLWFWFRINQNCHRPRTQSFCGLHPVQYSMTTAYSTRPACWSRPIYMWNYTRNLAENCCSGYSFDVWAGSSESRVGCTLSARMLSIGVN